MNAARRPPTAVPLARLFAIAYRSIIDDMHDRLRERGFTGVRPAFGFVLLAARERPTSSTELAVLMGTSKQAASKLIDAMAAAGFVERLQGAEDARQRPVQLTADGARLLGVVESIYAELEAEWAAVVGEADIEQLRQSLQRVLEHRHGGELPPVRPTW